MAISTERLMKLKEEIEHAKLDRASVEGALKQNMERLKTEFQCRSIEAANVKLAKLKDEKTRLEGLIEEAITKLEGSYQW